MKAILEWGCFAYLGGPGISIAPVHINAMLP